MVVIVDKVSAKAATEALLKILSGGDVSTLDGSTILITVKNGRYELVLPSGPILGDDIA